MVRFIARVNKAGGDIFSGSGARRAKQEVTGFGAVFVSVQL